MLIQLWANGFAAVSKGAAPQRSWGVAGVVCHGRAGSNNGRSHAVAGGLGQLRGGKGELSSEDDEEGAAGGSDGLPPPPPTIVFCVP